MKKYGFIISAMFIAIVALTAAFAVFYDSNRQLKEYADSTQKNQSILEQLDLVLIDLIDIESNTRGYILFPKQHFLISYYEHRVLLNRRLEELKDFTQHDLQQKVLIHKLADLIHQRIVYSDTSIQI